MIVFEFKHFTDDYYSETREFRWVFEIDLSIKWSTLGFSQQVRFPKRSNEWSYNSNYYQLSIRFDNFKFEKNMFLYDGEHHYLALGCIWFNWGK